MNKGMSRRQFICSLAGCAAAVTCGCSDISHTGWFRKNFRDMSPEELTNIIADLEKKHSSAFGKTVTVGTEGPLPGVHFAYALDISRCVGCRRCVHACVEENNQSRDPEVQWIRVLEMDQEKGIDFQHANPYYEPELVPREGHFYLPVACQQCEKPSCVKSCPVGATWRDDDGITVIDYDWCIGCRCCLSACPYGARRYNWSTPTLSADQMNPKTHYLGNRPRMKGVVEKCTFCVQRVRNGQYPRCVEICPTGSRKFGNLLDADSEIRYILENKRVVVLKNELNTHPRFYYFFS